MIRKFNKYIIDKKENIKNQKLTFKKNTKLLKKKEFSEQLNKPFNQLKYFVKHNPRLIPLIND